MHTFGFNLLQCARPPCPWPSSYCVPVPRAAAPRPWPSSYRVPRAPRCALAEERVESAKAGAVAAVAGSLLGAPAALLAPDRFTAQWEFGADTLAVELLLFGLVYRYAVRSDDNPMLKQGVVGAFALTRALSSAHVGDQCTAMPLSCGAPLGYLDWGLLGQLTVSLATSGVAFGAAAAALELCFGRGWVRPLPAEGLPEE